MKASYKHLTNFCHSINATILKKTQFGVRVEKAGSGYELVRNARSPADREKFPRKVMLEGTAKECYIYLIAIRDVVVNWYPHVEQDPRAKDIDGTESSVKFM